MIKQLLATAAIAAVSLCATAAPTVLWTADAPEGEAIEGWHDFLKLSAEESAVLNAGDIVTMTITAKGTTGWPQVGIFEGDTGWPPLASTGAGDVPNSVTLAITYDMAEKIHQNGATFKGESVYVSEISYEKSAIEVGPYTVWFGPKQCAWGDAVSVSNEVFADVKVGDKLQVQYDTAAPEHTLQIILGGWSGLNLATYEAGNYDFMTIDEETGWITIELVEALANFDLTVDGDVKNYDAFKLLKEGGVVMQGPCIVNQVLFVPASDASVNYYAVGGFQGWNVEEPAQFTLADGVYTLVAEKASTMKISTLYGNWEDFNSATIAPSMTDQIFDDGSVPFVVTPDYEFVMDYEATWTVTINPDQQSIKFSTNDPRPQVDIYVRGGMNGWEAVDEWKLTSTDGNIYKLANVSIAEGVEFKIADSSWGTINYGASEAVAPNVPAILVYNGNNIKLTEAVENAEVEFDLSTKTLTVNTGTGINAINSDNATTVFYNLQGVKVANPTEGNIYIIKKGNKVSKIAF
ncbi:MAG: hypothetical protein K2L22_03695 [Muribaculaceae bacterium]|nr:hypothetical protein [Muribaculaceae bacterium]